MIVWRAVNESDDFAELQNLKHIRQHRKLVATLEEVYKIHANEYKEWPQSNPLLAGGKI